MKLLKKDPVLVIALALGILSLIIIRPAAADIPSFIDFRVLAILLSLMLVMEGFKGTGLFASLAAWLIKKCTNTRLLEIILVFLCFFLSMLITNDVALITFVPFSILALKISDNTKRTIPVVVMQTLAANLGSMLTPLGNPQNLYLYNLMGVSFGEFILIMLPFTALAGVMLLIICLVREGAPLTELKDIDGISGPRISRTHGAFRESAKKVALRHNIMYGVLFVVCLLCVIKVIDYRVMLVIVLVGVFAIDRRIFRAADYGLLLTFIGFFLFIGSMGEVQVIKEYLSKAVAGHEFLWGVAASQVISNVPAALLLSGFADSLKELLYGVNVGGLGTLIASMASLISFKQVTAEDYISTGKYMIVFTISNVVFLILMILLHLAF
ncbi:MAG: citrate transporter [Lachnospiraceae bacterium]|nr:citrate transporter [Lachnospiraceae bacterium]